MRTFRTQEVVLLVTGVASILIGAFGDAFLADSDVGWLFAVMGVAIVVFQFTIVKEIRDGFATLVRQLNVNNRHLSWVLEWKRAELNQFAVEASQGTINMSLDDLFRTVTHLVEQCDRLDAVDIKRERWVEDIRAIKYLEGCRKAAARNAVITRVIVLPREMREQVRSLLTGEESTLEARLLADLLVRQREAGIRAVKIIYTDQAPPTYIRDFGIFDDEVVLDEQFDADGNSLYKGLVSASRNILSEYREIFQHLFRVASSNDDLVARLMAWQDERISPLDVTAQPDRNDRPPFDITAPDGHHPAT